VRDKPVKDLVSSSESIVLSIILINYNGKGVIGKCLDSIKKNRGDIESEVIVVDNHSTDGSVDWLKKNYPDIRLICNHENLGFSKANNQGIKASSGQYILFLNPDTLIYPNSIKKLLTEIENNSDIGAAGPALLNRKNDFQVSFGGRVDFFSEAAKKLFLNRVVQLRLKKNQKKRDVKWLSAACLLCSSKVLKEAGMFDENFFLYFEDIDLCLRIRKKGWKLVYLPAAKVFHSGGESTQKRKLKSRFHYRQSQLYFYRKHNPVFSLFWLKVFLCINFVLILIQGFFKKKKDFKDRIRFFKLLRKQV